MNKASYWVCTIVIIIGVASAFHPVACRAEESEPEIAETPLWEFVLFNTAARIPHYRGSDEVNWYFLPLPYLIYRGDVFRIDREGFRGIFYESEYFETDISLFGNPPVDDDNDAREGMDDLDPLFELGPELKWFFTGRDPLNELYLRTALRGVFSIGWDGGPDLAYQGLHGGVNLIYNNGRLFRDQRLRFGFNLGVDVTDADFNDYFYEVDPEDVRPDRPRYNPDGGYAGFSVGASVAKQLTDSLRWGIYGRWDNIDGAAFDDSPLVRQENNFFFGTVLTWRIYSSKQMVPARRETE